MDISGLMYLAIFPCQISFLIKRFLFKYFDVLNMGMYSLSKKKEKEKEKECIYDYLLFNFMRK